MKLYKRMVKPIIVSPNKHMEFLSQDVENDDIWYEEELIPELRNKFSKDRRICEPFIYLSFRDKYVEVNMDEEFDKDREAKDMAISALSENKGEWIPFSKELPPKYKKVHVSTFGIVTIGERTSEADEALRLSILEPMNNLYKNIDPKQYQITHWQPLPKGM